MPHVQVPCDIGRGNGKNVYWPSVCWIGARRKKTLGLPEFIPAGFGRARIVCFWKTLVGHLLRPTTQTLGECYGLLSC